MGNVSEQFRGFTGVEDPDPALGLENAKGVEGGEPVDTGDTLGLDEVETDHVDGGDSYTDEDATPAERTKVRTETGDRIEEAKDAHADPRVDGETPPTGEDGTFADVREDAEREADEAQADDSDDETDDSSEQE
jgi:hypothetical protein